MVTKNLIFISDKWKILCMFLIKVLFLARKGTIFPNTSNATEQACHLPSWYPFHTPSLGFNPFQTDSYFFASFHLNPHFAYYYQSGAIGYVYAMLDLIYMDPAYWIARQDYNGAPHMHTDTSNTNMLVYPI
jgi:hypothetical protein